MGVLSVYKNSSLAELLHLAREVVENFKNNLLLTKERSPEIFSEESLYQIYLSDISDHHLVILERLYKEFLGSKKDSQNLQLEFVRQILLQNLIPHFQKMSKNFCIWSKIDDLDIKFADMHISNLKEQIRFLR